MSAKLVAVGVGEDSAEIYLEANGSRWLVATVVKSDAVFDPLALARFLASAPDFAAVCKSTSSRYPRLLSENAYWQLVRTIEDVGATSLETAGVSRSVTRCDKCRDWGDTVPDSGFMGIPCPVCGRRTYPNEGVNMEPGSSICLAGRSAFAQAWPSSWRNPRAHDVGRFRNVSYLVELEPGVYLSDAEDGDPPRTLKKENARRFASVSAANRGLKDARRSRPFADAVVVSYSE